MQNNNNTTLRHLLPGDRFFGLHDKARKVFEVVGTAEFNRGHGSATRLCKTDNGDRMHKSCRLEVRLLPKRK